MYAPIVGLFDGWRGWRMVIIMEKKDTNFFDSNCKKWLPVPAPEQWTKNVLKLGTVPRSKVMAVTWDASIHSINQSTVVRHHGGIHCRRLICDSEFLFAPFSSANIYWTNVFFILFRENGRRSCHLWHRFSGRKNFSFSRVALLSTIPYIRYVWTIFSHLPGSMSRFTSRWKWCYTFPNWNAVSETWKSGNIFHILLRVPYWKQYLKPRRALVCGRGRLIDWLTWIDWIGLIDWIDWLNWIVLCYAFPVSFVSCRSNLIDFDEESNTISRTVYAHPSGEVWHLASCPYDSGLFATCFNEGTLISASACFLHIADFFIAFPVENSKVISRAALWRFPDSNNRPHSSDDHQSQPVAVPQLEKILDFRDDDPTSDTVGYVLPPPSYFEVETLRFQTNKLGSSLLFSL